MRILIAEDDFASRRLLQKFLSKYGDVDLASDGKEAVDAWRLAYEEGNPYDLLCLDLMMPVLDGHEVLQTIRLEEQDRSILPCDGVKVIITTALSDASHIMQSFREGCEAYIVKPIDKKNLLEQMKSLGLKFEEVK
jgi:two-component system, chemotaxis family, chemotaxis protein CheY